MSSVPAAEAHPVQTWVCEFGPELRRHLTRMMGNEDDAEDVLQQVWVRAYRKPPDMGPGSNVRAWLYRVGTNAALDRLAREKRHDAVVQERPAGLEPSGVAAPDASLDGLGEAARARIREHCARLPRKQREAVWFRWVEGEDYETIARRLGSSVESARANVYHGMKRLRRELRDLWREEERA